MCVAELFGGDSLGLVEGSAVLLGDLLQDASQSGNGSQHGTQNLSLQDGQCGDGSQRVDSLHGNDLAVHEATLQLELAVELLSVVSDDAGGSHGIIVADSQRSGAVQQTIQIFQTGVVESKAQQGVLDNGIINVVLTALLTQSGVFLNGNALVVDEDAGGGILDLLGQLLDGDAVTVIKDLKVKGSSMVIKRGTKVKSIRLTDNPEEVDCKIDGSSIVLKTCFLKK